MAVIKSLTLIIFVSFILLDSLGFLLADEHWHASNEYLRLSSIRKGQLTYCYYLQHLADEENKLKKYKAFLYLTSYKFQSIIKFLLIIYLSFYNHF